MLASKTAGVTDPLQQTASGTHTFTWSDILAQHEDLRNDPRFGSSVFLLLSTDFGRAVTLRGKPYYVTVADEGFTDATSVRDWCSSTFTEFTGAALADACTPAQLTPPVKR